MFSSPGSDAAWGYHARHRRFDPTFVCDAMRRPGAQHDTILTLAREIVHAGHIHASLRMVQVHGVMRFAHLMGGITLELPSDFMHERDAAAHSTLVYIMDLITTDDETAAHQLCMSHTGMSTMLGGIAGDSLIHKSRERSGTSARSTPWLARSPNACARCPGR